MSPFDTEQETNELLAKCDSILAENPGNRCCKYLKEYVKSDEFKNLSEAGELSHYGKLFYLLQEFFDPNKVVVSPFCMAK